MLLVLDAMGYHVANAIGYLTEAGKTKLIENLLRMSTLLEGEEWMLNGVWVTTDAYATPDDWPLQIVLLPAPETKLEQRILYLETVNSGQVGVVRLGPADGNGRLTIHDFTIHAMPTTTLPDPTIAATVDFVLSEARRYQQRRDSD